MEFVAIVCVRLVSNWLKLFSIIVSGNEIIGRSFNNISLCWYFYHNVKIFIHARQYKNSLKKRLKIPKKNKQCNDQKKNVAVLCKILHRKLNIYIYILHFTFLFSLFVFVSAAGHYFCIWTGHYFSIWTGQVPALLF